MLIQQKQLSPNVDIVGMVDREKLNDYYNSANVMLVTSYPEEGGPVAVLESLAVGTPVIAAPVGFIPEIAQSARALLTVVHPDAESFTQALHLVLQQQSRTVKPVVVQPWTWDDVVKTVRLVYQQHWQAKS